MPANPVELLQRPLIEGPATFQDKIIVPKEGGSGGGAIQVDPNDPTFSWRDIEGRIFLKTTGVGAPVLAVYRGGSVRQFAYAANDGGDGEYHIPHDYVLGSDLYIHAHWSHHGTGISGSFVLNYFITYAKGHNQANFSAEVAPVLTVLTPDIATVPQYRHRIDEIQLSAATPSVAQIDTDEIEPDGLILLHWDVNTIPTITGGATNKPFIHYIDIHYQSTNIGTKQKAANFYV